jgi:hypothetical protein
MIFESEETRVVILCAAHVKLQRTIAFRRYDGVPQKPGHRSKMIESVIRTAILVINRALEAQRQNGCHWRSFLICYSHFQSFPLALTQVPKPYVGCRRKAMPPSDTHKQFVEIVQELLRISASFNQASPVSPMDPSLNRILVKTPEQVLKTGTKIKEMKVVLSRRKKTPCVIRSSKASVRGSQFKVLQLFMLECGP